MAEISIEEYMENTKQLSEKSVVLDNLLSILDSSEGRIRDIRWVENIRDMLNSLKEEVTELLVKNAKDFINP
jgi:hypothetical protein